MLRSFAAFTRSLAQPPETLQRREKVLLAVLTLAVAVSRLFALSTSQLDWDEALFAGGVRSYDVTSQHPHPPGYPLFILFAKLAKFAVHDDFRALRLVVAVASLLLFPATFFLVRELRVRFRVAITAAVLAAFLPTVWYYGGTGLSDIPALAAIVAASALLLAGGRNPKWWTMGMFLTGVAAGIRPLHVVIAAVPALAGALAWRSRGRSEAEVRVGVTRGIAVFLLVAGASYAGAALATRNPPWGYLHQIGMTAHHIGTVDSYNNAGRPPLPKLVPLFFVHAHRGGRAGIALLLLALLGLGEALFRRRASILVLLGTFVPIALVTWAMLDLTAVTRYALAYVLLYPICAAFGIEVIAERFRTGQAAVVAVTATALAGAFIAWTSPGLAVVRRAPSPPVSAMQWIRTNVPKDGPTLYIDDALVYHADYALDGYRKPSFRSYDQIPDDAYVPGNYCLVDRLTIQPHARYFSFLRARLGQIARDVYFETSILPMDAMIRFGDGWYQDEYDGSRAHAWRWMRGSSVALFPAIPSSGILRLRFHVPLDALQRPPVMTVSWNGTLLIRRTCGQPDFELRFELPSRTAAPNECRITTDEVATVPGDGRQFGLQLLAVSWERTDGVPYGL